MIPAKINPTKRDRRVKLWRALFARWWDANGLVVVMLLNIAWLWVFWFGIMDMR